VRSTPAPGRRSGTRADAIAVWNLTNTKSLSGRDPNRGLNVVVLPFEEYTRPPNATQALGTIVIYNNLGLLAADDDRMNQVVYAGGHLWSSLNTAVQTPHGLTLPGLAWFVTTPATDPTGALSATVAKHGYLAVNKEDLLYPSIGVTVAGKAVMAFTLTGPTTIPAPRGHRCHCPPGPDRSTSLPPGRMRITTSAGGRATSLSAGAITRQPCLTARGTCGWASSTSPASSGRTTPTGRRTSPTSLRKRRAALPGRFRRDLALRQLLSSRLRAIHQRHTLGQSSCQTNSTSSSGPRRAAFSVAVAKRLQSAQGCGSLARDGRRFRV
jgi:hypothetical protein